MPRTQSHWLCSSIKLKLDLLLRLFYRHLFVSLELDIIYSFLSFFFTLSYVSSNKAFGHTSSNFQRIQSLSFVSTDNNARTLFSKTNSKQTKKQIGKPHKAQICWLMHGRGRGGLKGFKSRGGVRAWVCVCLCMCVYGVEKVKWKHSVANCLFFQTQLLLSFQCLMSLILCSTDKPG